MSWVGGAGRAEPSLPPPPPPPPPRNPWLYVSLGGGRRRDLRTPVREGWPCISGEVDPALGKYEEKLAWMGRRRETEWPCHDGWSLYHAAALASGALRAREYSLGQCSECAAEWVSVTVHAVSVLMEDSWDTPGFVGLGEECWAALCAPVRDAQRPPVRADVPHRAAPHEAEIRALARALGRVVVLLYSERPAAADPLDRRGLLYVFHPDERGTYAYELDEDLRPHAEGAGLADAWAWGEFRAQALRGAVDLGRDGLDGAAILVYDALRGRYAAAMPRVGYWGEGASAPAAAATAVRQLHFGGVDTGVGAGGR